MQQNKKLIKCDFCKYHSASGCNARPDSFYCKEANDEFFNWLREQKAKKSKQYK